MSDDPRSRAIRRGLLAGGVLTAIVAFLAVTDRSASSGPAAARAPGALPAGLVRRGASVVATADGAEMVFVPAGEFRMGSDDGAFDERPRHPVRLRAYWIDRHEVTNAQFQRFLERSSHRPEGPWERGAGPGLGGRPVRFVTWHDAAAYAAWAGRRLPTEAQWERAARGTDGRRYPWGDVYEPGRLCADRDVEAGPLDVGSFPSGASACGALDLAGNVWEWVADWYDRRAYEARSRSEPTVEPAGPADGAPPEERFVATRTAGGNERSTRKAIRGGGWVASGSENARASKRAWGNPSYWLNDTGFRCALPAE